jgi:hypothetical protein
MLPYYTTVNVPFTVTVAVKDTGPHNIMLSVAGTVIVSETVARFLYPPLIAEIIPA